MEKIDVSRRGFFGVAAGEAVAGPAALRQTIAQRLKHVGGVGYAMAPMPGHDDTSPWARARSELQALMRKGEMPDWKHREVRQQARNRSHVLDPDIFELRSVSMARKHAMQEDREYQRIIDEQLAEAERERGWTSLVGKFEGLLGKII